MNAAARVGRDAASPRPIEVELGVIRGIAGSVLYRSGRTEVLCTATLVFSMSYGSM